MRKFMKILFLVTSICWFSYSQSAFEGHSGIYYLGTADVPIKSNVFTLDDITGVVVRFRWEKVEPKPGEFDWSFIDQEITKAKSAGKRVSLQPLSVPAWMHKDLEAQAYYYIDKNENHSTFGKVLSDVIPWDEVYIARVKMLLEKLAEKYANEETVSYINAIGGQFSRNLPDTIVTDTLLKTKQPFWKAFSYSADSLAIKINLMTDFYMDLFKKTPLWCSVDYVKFEQKATGKPSNYLASLYTTYGVANYPERFGLWREDISPCTPYETISSGSQWTIMKDNSCRTGAQMLWNVQDGPTRMNKCRTIDPNSKSLVLEAAIENGIKFGMRYIEIYGADIEDQDLKNEIKKGNSELILKGEDCSPVTTAVDLLEENSLLKIYPNPVESSFINIRITDDLLFKKFKSFKMYNVIGIQVLSGSSIIDPVTIPDTLRGHYIIVVDFEDKKIFKKIIIP